MARPIPQQAQCWLSGVTTYLRAFEEDHAMGLSLLALAGDMRGLSESAAKAADALRDAYLAAEDKTP